MEFENSLEFAKRLDADDPLQGYRDKFHIPKTDSGDDYLYFTGNSLGLQPKTTSKWVSEELEDWQNLGVKGHVHARRPWVSYHHTVKEGLGKIVGGHKNEVVAMSSLTANLHALMVSFYRPTKKRHKILMMNQAFPSDWYAIESQIKFHGFDPETSRITVGPEGSDGLVDERELYNIIETQGDEIALILIEGVSYITGQFFDLKKIAELGHAKGCVVGADLAHAVGNVELNLHDDGVDFAVWCSYKYLNSGPGCIAGAFVHNKHAKSFDLPLFAGWWGHDEETRFLMGKEFSPIEGVDRWQVSNIPIMTTACLQASLAIFDEVTVPTLRKKSVQLTGFLEFLLNDTLGDKVTIVTPSDPSKRGCQLSLKVEGGKSIHEKLIEKGVACDWREPNVIRLAPVPLYNRFEDVYRFVQVLKESL